jgi:hypothetical protein
MAGMPNCGNAGHPALPAMGAQILIPFGVCVENVETVLNERISLGKGFNIEPMAQPVPLSAEFAMESLPLKDDAIYSLNTPFPKTKCENIGAQYFRGYQILVLKLNPVEYIPSTGEIFCYPRMEIVINTVADGKESSLFRGLPEDEKEISGKVDNPEAVASYMAVGKSGTTNYDLLILTVPWLADAFQPLKDYHDTTGVPTEIRTIVDVITEMGGGTTEDIREFIRQRYLNDGIQFPQTCLIQIPSNMICPATSTMPASTGRLIMTATAFMANQTMVRMAVMSTLWPKCM